MMSPEIEREMIRRHRNGTIRFDHEGEFWRDDEKRTVKMMFEEGYGILGLDLGSDGAGSIHLMQPAGGSRNPASHETVDAKEHTVHMNGNEVFKFAVKIMGKTAKKSLEQAGLTNEDIDMLVPHQANIRIIQSAAKHFKMPMDKVWVNIDKYSNTSAACIPIALTEMQDQHAMKKGDNLLLVAFGAGLTWGSIVLKWCK